MHQSSVAAKSGSDVMGFLPFVSIAALLCGCVSLLSLTLIFPVSTTPLSGFQDRAPTTCPVCYQCSINPITSTPSDLILTFAYPDVSAVRGLLVSIRSVGIRSQVVLVLISGTSIPPDIEALLESCDIQTFFARVDNTSLLEAPSVFRYLAYRQFLASRTFNRILHVDPAHVYFQGDPFTDSLSDDGVHVVLEGESISASADTSRSIADCYGAAELSRLSPYRVASAGIFGGGAATFEPFVANLSVPDCYRQGDDQAHLNHWLWAAAPRAPFTYHGCDSQIVTGTSCVSAHLLNSYRVFVGATGNEAAVFREFAAIVNVPRYIDQVCNIMSPSQLDAVEAAALAM
jgi:hypothetical protein